jgi:diacylglycerol kinase (ATP)
MRIKAIINPKAQNGMNHSLESILRENFAADYLDIERTTHPGHATQIAHSAAFDKIDTIVTVGGDGTINEVINGMAGSQLTLGIIPCGTANDLATQHCIPRDTVKACEIIRKGNKKYIDLIDVNGQYYATAGGIGLPSEVARIANTIKNEFRIGQILAKILGSKLYMLALLYAFLSKNSYSNSLLIKMNGTLQKFHALFVMINNQPFLGKNFYVSPRAVNDDGIFNICMAEHPGGRLEILNILIKTLSGAHVNLPTVKNWSGAKFVMYTQKPTSYLADGELYDNISKFIVRIVPKALPILVPDASGSEV